MCVGRTNGRSHSFVLDFSFVSFLCIKTKKRKKNIYHFLFFLLLVQKKEPKKSTPAMIYSHCRPDSYRDWLNSSTTVNWTKQFLSSASTIFEISLYNQFYFLFVNLPAPSFSSNNNSYFFKECKRKRQRLHELQIARSNNFKISAR